jgi:hypothetical protein
MISAALSAPHVQTHAATILLVCDATAHADQRHLMILQQLVLQATEPDA